ncbi:hypothetical protein [Methylobacterium sp. 1030]|uniref:hypothetical protein n=1 Tax=Methylobacterium sp. 1030 TaxID=3156404 RepID=UPI003395A429
MSVSAAALRKLAALDLSAEQMAGVLELMADIQEKEETRLAEQRERKRRSRDKSRDKDVTVTGQSQPGFPPCPLPSFPAPNHPSPIPPSRDISAPPPKKASKPDRQAPPHPATDQNLAQWMKATGHGPSDLPQDWGDWAYEQNGMSAKEIDEQWQLFRLYYLQNASKPNGRKDDWFAAWQSWCIKSPEFKNERRK